MAHDLLANFFNSFLIVLVQVQVLFALRCHAGVAGAAIGNVRLAALCTDVAGLGRVALVVRAFRLDAAITCRAVRDVLLAARCTDVAGF